MPTPKVKYTPAGENLHPLPAIADDFANGKRIEFTNSVAATAVALSEGLWTFMTEGSDCYICIGANPTADGSAAGSLFLPQNYPWWEVIYTSGLKVSVKGKTGSGVLWALPAVHE